MCMWCVCVCVCACVRAACVRACVRACLCCIVLYCIVLYCIVLYCIVLYCIVLYCIVLYCIVLYCIVLYCIYDNATMQTIPRTFVMVLGNKLSKPENVTYGRPSVSNWSLPCVYCAMRRKRFRESRLLETEQEEI